MTRIEEFAPDGTLRTTRTIDIDAGTVAIEEDGTTTTEPLDPDTLADLRQQQREQRQLERLEARFRALKDDTTLRDTDRLTVSDYGPVATTDLRPLVRLVNTQRATILDLRAMVLDLTRLVRGIAADDE